MRSDFDVANKDPGKLGIQQYMVQKPNSKHNGVLTFICRAFDALVEIAIATTTILVGVKAVW